MDYARTMDHARVCITLCWAGTPSCSSVVGLILPPGTRALLQCPRRFQHSPTSLRHPCRTPWHPVHSAQLATTRVAHPTWPLLDSDELRKRARGAVPFPCGRRIYSNPRRAPVDVFPVTIRRQRGDRKPAYRGGLTKHAAAAAAPSLADPGGGGEI